VRRILIFVLVVALGSISWGACERAEAIHTTPAVARWRDEALEAGWSKAGWRRLSCIIARESRGNPYAYNGRDPHGGSRGLAQINGVHTRLLIQRGIIRWRGDLFDPVRNLRAARLIWKAQGWGAWSSAKYC
jgi:hypothetical protein